MPELELQVNPRLAEYDAAAAAQVEAEKAGESTTPVIEEPAAPEAASTPAEPPVEAAPEVPAADQNRISFERGPNAYRQVQEFFENDPEFRHLGQTWVGRKARETRQQYEAKVTELETQLAVAQAKVRENTLAALDPTEIAQKYYDDPEFRKVVDSTPGNPADIARTASVRGAVNDIIDTVAHIIPPEVLQQQVMRLQNGAYDALPPEQGLIRFNQDLNHLAGQYMAARQVPPPPPQAAQPAPPAPAAAPAPAPATPNPALAAAGPDVSAPSVPASGMAVYKMSDVKTWPPPKRYEVWPNQGDFERDVASGKVVMDT